MYLPPYPVEYPCLNTTLSNNVFMLYVLHNGHCFTLVS